MTVALKAKLLALAPFAGIPSYDRQIEEIERQLSEVAGVTADEFTQKNAAQDIQINKKAERFLGAITEKYYIGGPLANAQNNGLTEQTPKLSISGVLRAADLSQAVDIELLGDVVTDDLFIHASSDVIVEISSKAGERHTLTFEGDGRLVFQASACLRLSNLSIMGDKRNAQSPVVIGMSGGVVMSSCDVDITPESNAAGSVAIFSIPAFSTFSTLSTVIEANADGKVFTESLGSNFSTRAAVTA